MSPFALSIRLLVLVLSALAFVAPSVAGASATALPPQCSVSFTGVVPAPDGRFPAEAGEAERANMSCTVPEGATATISVLEPPEHGTVSQLQQSPGLPGLAFASFTYTPQAAYRGSDEFTLRASAGTESGDVAVRVNVIDPVNNAPQCSAGIGGPVPGPDGRFPAEAGEPERGIISCSDDEGGNLTASVLEQPEHGDLSAPQAFPGSPGFLFASFSYTPLADYRGPDEFTLRASDGTNDVDVLVRVNVVDPVNSPPQCFVAFVSAVPGPDGRYPAEAGEAERGNISCSDEEGANLTFSVFGQPEHGDVSAPQQFPPGAPFGSFSYTGDADYRGPDEFTLRASDGTNDVDVLVRVNVIDPVNDPPVCFVPGAIPVEQGRTLTFTATTACSDPEGQPLTLTITDQPDHGPPIVEANGVFTYTAPTDYAGPDSFGVEISDGEESILGTVSILVVAPNRLVLTPPEDTPEVGSTHTVTATVRNQSGAPEAGQRVRWRIDGPGGLITGDALTNASGQVEISWTRSAHGTDVLAVLVDDDGDGVPDVGEPTQLARAHWRTGGDVDPPDAGKPTRPDGDPLEVSVGEIIDPADPDERTFAISLSQTAAAGIGACPGVVNQASRLMNLPISVSIDPGAGTVVPDSVELFQVASGAGSGATPLTPPGVKEHVDVNGSSYTFVLDCIRTGDLYVRYTLEENGVEQTFTVPIGGIVLIDPQGVVYDKSAFEQRIAAGDTPAQARAAAAISGAKVTLQRKVGGQFVNVLSGDPGIAPHINPHTTGADGKYQWDVSPGVYRVVVQKDGYKTATSRETTIPPPELELHVGLELVDTPQPGGGGGGGTSGGGGGGGAGGGPTLAAVIASVAQEATQSAKTLTKCGTAGLLRRAGCTDRFTALKGGTVVYRVTAPAARAGAAAAATIVIATGKKAFPAAGDYPVVVKATTKGRNRLKNARKLRATLTLKFTDTDGNVAAKSKKVVLKRKR